MKIFWIAGFDTRNPRSLAAMGPMNGSFDAQAAHPHDPGLDVVSERRLAFPASVCS